MDKDLIISYLDGTLDKEGTARLMAWVQESPENARMLFELKEVYLGLNYDSSHQQPWMEQEWKRIQDRTGMLKTPFYKKWWWHGIAVAVCLLMVAGILWRSDSLKNGGTAEAPVVFRTGFGQRAETLLPDGSLICLNACSLLSYDPQSWDRNRTVVLQGEASFDIVHRDNAPFSVQTSGFSVSVLGTSFDISNYSEEEEALISLKNGKVHVDISGAALDLVPGKTLRFNRELGSWQIHDTRDQDLSWEKEIYVFDNVPLEKMQHALSRHFGYSFDIAPNCRKQSYHAHLEHESLGEFLDLLTAVSPDLAYTINHDARTVRIFKR